MWDTIVYIYHGYLPMTPKSSYMQHGFVEIWNLGLYLAWFKQWFAAILKLMKLTNKSYLYKFDYLYVAVFYMTLITKISVPPTPPSPSPPLTPTPHPQPSRDSNHRRLKSQLVRAKKQTKRQSSTLLTHSEVNSPMTGEVPSQRASDMESFSMSWPHDVRHAAYSNPNRIFGKESLARKGTY